MIDAGNDRSVQPTGSVHGELDFAASSVTPFSANSGIVSPPEFEAVCHDLMQRHLQVPLQAFTSGRDQGIDLRHAPSKDGHLIIQCKNYANSPFAALRQHIAKGKLMDPHPLALFRFSFMRPTLAQTVKTCDEFFSRKRVRSVCLSRAKPPRKPRDEK